ncbi:MAG TPA: hypothetical protein VF378_03540, partial [Geothrix sp.]
MYESKGAASKFPPSPDHRKHLLQVISAGRTRFNIPFDETVLAEAMSWFEKGDASVLPAILDSGKHADGAVSELLGSFLGETLIRCPEILLT